jgi:uncharacterized protein (DUF1015 family)
MADVRPFRALRPRADLAAEVIAPPYDVLSEAEARALARNPRSFVRVTRSEVDLEQGADPHSDRAYDQARRNLDAFVAEGVLVEDAEPTYSFYGQTMGTHEQIGILGAASVEEYDRGLIAKHELTRPDKEDDRTHHMDVLDAQVGLVFLAHRPSAALDRITAEVTASPPAWKVTTEDGVVHRLWIAPRDAVPKIREAFAAMKRLYVADGHHRSAAASRIHADRHSDTSAHFLAGLYPSDRLLVLAYNRVVSDRRGLSAAGLRDAIAETYEVEEEGRDTPRRRGEIAVYADRRWTTWRVREAARTTDPVGGLDVSVLQDRLLRPHLGIDDPRTSDRITFVGGIRGVEALERAVGDGPGVAFHLFPTSLDELFAVADAGRIMPPKSTWFEPKLREGVVVRRL